MENGWKSLLAQVVVGEIGPFVVLVYPMEDTPLGHLSRKLRYVGGLTVGRNGRDTQITERRMVSS